MSKIPQQWDEMEIQEWLESFDSVLRDSGPEAVSQILRRSAVARINFRSRNSIFGAHALREYDSREAAAGISRRSGNGAAHQEPGAMERAGHGGAREPRGTRNWRAHFDVRFGGNII